MKTGKIERIERITLLLEQDIDFVANDLVDHVNGLKILSKEWENKFITKNIGDKVVFLGYYDKETKTIIIKVERELYI